MTPNPKQFRFDPVANLPLAEPASIRNKLLALLRAEPLVNSVVAMAIGVGFIHGWLKIRFAYAATTFVFDAILSLAVLLVLIQEKKGRFIPEGAVGTALKWFYALCALYLLFPGGPPLLVALAAMRGWCFATLMFCVGYRVIRGIAQVKGYFYVLILLGLGTAIYGIRQTPADVEKRMAEDERFAERYMNTYYHTSKGRQLRRFSTFVSSGAFGGTMAYVAIFAIALVSDPRAGKRERALLLAVGPIGYAIVLSGARSALVSLVVGLLVIAWHRRNFQNFILIPAMVVLVIKLGADTTGGSATERYSSLLNFDEIYYRQSIPTLVGWNFMDEHPFGGGIGRSGHSVPSFLSGRYAYREYVFADGDLGRLMIDLGWLGLLFFGRIIFVALRTSYHTLQKLRETSVSTVALASAACIVMAVVTLPSGSPFLSIPMGALVWFFLGTLCKLSDSFTAGTFDVTTQTVTETAPAKPMLFRHQPSRPAPPNP